MDFNVNKTTTNYSDKLRKKLSVEYDVFEELLDLSQFGVPQQRTRYFLLALQPGFTELNPFELLRERLPSFLRSLGLKAPVGSWTAISDLEVSRGGRQPSRDTPGFEEIRYMKPLTHFQKMMSAGKAGPTDLRLARHSVDITNRFQDIIESSHAEGRLNTTISDDVRSRYGLLKKALRVLDPDRPAPTITSLPDDLLHYSEPRALTVRENARLQSFPDWFSFKGKYTTGGLLRRKEVPRFTQVANAVPPLVARALGEMLIELFDKSSRRSVVSRKAAILQ
jgi:DNA (cytosine-5)-methyltransferase 1